MQTQSETNSNIFGGFSMKLDYQEEKKKNTPNFTVQIENGQLNNEYQLNSKVDLFVKLMIENQHFKTPISVDCGANPTWGKEAVYSFFENQLIQKEYKMHFELWNYETELGDVQIGVGELDLINSFNNNIKLAKIVLYDANNVDRQIGYLITNLKFAYNFVGGKKIDLPRYGSPLKFTKHVPIQGLTISKRELEERNLSFEERMKNLKEKYNIQPQKKEDFQYQDIEISQEVYKAVHEGLVFIAKNRSLNPLRDLGSFLCKYPQNQ